MVQNYTIIMNNATFGLYFFYFTKKKLVEDTEFPCGKLSLKLCGFINICKSSKYSHMNSSPIKLGQNKPKQTLNQIV